MNYKITTIILTILSLVLFVLTVHYYNNPQIEYRTVENTDTLEIHIVDTIILTNKDIIYRDVHILDTIYLKDTALFVEQKVFSDSISTIYISGVNTELDSIEYRLSRDTVKIEIEKVQTVKEQESFWHNRFTISAGIFLISSLLIQSS